jgi:Spy/CpxP family protein refolding chaperone
MKRAILFAWLCLIAALEVQAQDRTQEGLDWTIQQLSARLKLSPEQEKKISAIMYETQEALKKDREAAEGNRWALMRAWRERIQDMDAKIESELQDEQKAIYAELKKERRERMMQRWRERRGE